MSKACTAVVVLAKCGENHKTYGIRAEEGDNDTWLFTWAFPINDSSAKREGYDKTAIKGNIVFTRQFPGCPYCKGDALAVCACGHLNCITNKNQTFTCRWCGKQGKLAEYTGEAITAGADA